MKKIVSIFKNKWVLAGLAIAVLIVIFLVKRDTDQKTLQKKNSIVVQRKTLKETLSISGSINAREKTTLRFLTAGKITWIGVKEGDTVKKYQAIATMDQREVQDNLKKYLNTYMKYRWDLEQNRDTYKNQVLTDAAKRIIEKSQFDVDSSVADVEIKALAIEYSTLVTPIAGIVTHVGNSVAGVNAYLPTQAEFEIVSPDTIYFSATADQTDVIKLYEQMEGSLILDSFQEQEVPVKISNIAFSPKADETGTVYEIKLALNQYSVATNAGVLRLGMTGDVSFVTSIKNDVLAVPTKYLKTEGQTKYVWVLSQNGKKTKQVVTIGSNVNNDTEIISGLSQGDKITD